MSQVGHIPCGTLLRWKRLVDERKKSAWVASDEMTFPKAQRSAFALRMTCLAVALLRHDEIELIKLSMCCQALGLATTIHYSFHPSNSNDNTTTEKHQWVSYRAILRDCLDMDIWMTLKNILTFMELHSDDFCFEVTYLAKTRTPGRGCGELREGRRTPAVCGNVNEVSPFYCHGVSECTWYMVHGTLDMSFSLHDGSLPHGTKISNDIKRP